MEHMFSSLSKFSDFGLLVLRLGIGAAMICYGFPKLAGGMHKWEEIGKAMGVLGVHFLPAVWGFLCAMTETVGGLLIALGAAFRPAAMLLTFNFIVATTMLYKTTGEFMKWGHPAELLVLFFSLIFIGAGKYSIDRS